MDLLGDRSGGTGTSYPIALASVIAAAAIAIVAGGAWYGRRRWLG